MALKRYTKQNAPAKLLEVRARNMRAGVPLGLCQCGCGAKTNITKLSATKEGAIKGEPYLYVQGHQKRGRTCTEEHKARVAATKRGVPNLAVRGEKHPCWAGGVSKVRKELYATRREYYAWAQAVRWRDRYRCQVCRGRGSIAHHIKPYGLFPQHRLNLHNGLTVCKPCHVQLHRAIGLFYQSLRTRPAQQQIVTG